MAHPKQQFLPTIKFAIKEGEKIIPASPNQRLELEVLLAHVLQVSRVYLYAHQNDIISEELFQTYQMLCERRAKGEPIAYLLGVKEFWSIELEVNKDTLIPRPETELLVQITLEQLPQYPSMVVADLGVGSGAVAIALAVERPHWHIYGTDLSAAALKVAARNVAKQQISNVTLLLSDWCSNLPEKKFDAIVTNPPYIAEGDAHLESLNFEPQLALTSGKDGLVAIRDLILQVRNFLKKGGIFLLEHGYRQGSSVRSLLKKAGFINIETYRDIEGNERVTVGTWGKNENYFSQ